jgi:uncharacterized protein DUF748
MARAAIALDGRAIRKHPLRKFILWTLGAFVALGACARPVLPWFVRQYVNKALNHSLLYEGRIGDVSLHLWRGAYSISNVRIFKRTGAVPEPFFSCKSIDLAIQWNALLNHKIVGEVSIEQPVINFVAPSNQNEGQTGADQPWMETIRSLFPFQINRLNLHNGSIHFRSYVRAQPVDVYLSNLQASIEDLSNVERTAMPMMATVNATGTAMDQANFEFHMKLDPFSYYPTFIMTVRLLGLDVTKLNDLTQTYGDFQFKQGWFDLVLEAKAEEGQINGSVKPLFRNLVVFDPALDVKMDKDVLQFFWQALLGVVTTIFKNSPRDQFGTLVPFTGDLTAPNVNYLSAVGNVLQNAFVRAYLPRLDNGTDEYEGMQFQAGTPLDPTQTGDSP